MDLPEHWNPLHEADAERFEVELRRELPPSHVLVGVRLRAVARWHRRDDILFAAVDDAPRVYWVHLTWREETDPTWPWTIPYDSQADFVARWRDELGLDDEDL